MRPFSLEAKDCLPFTIKGRQADEASDADLRVMDKAMRQFCNYWYAADGYSDDDDYLARLQTQPASDASDMPSTQWCAGRYIGIAHLRMPLTEKSQQVDISIRPRFGESFLLAILEDIYNIRVAIQDAADSQSAEWFSSLLNILRRRMWVDKCAKANRYGLPRTNVRQEHQGAALRGTLDVRRTIRPWLFQKEVCSTTYEKVLDDVICKIVYEAHRILSKNIVTIDRKRSRGKQNDQRKDGFGFSMPPTVQDTINALNAQFKGTQFDLTENDYSRIRYKSIYLSWKPLVDFSWSVIRGRQISYQASESQTECVFVDMAEIWETFLRKKLAEGFRDEGWRVLTVEECHYLIYKDKFYEREIIPDIILQRGSDYMVFDAKYKRMRGRKSKGKLSDVDRSDLFQIHTYIQFVQHHLGNVVLGGLLYPISKDDVSGRDDVDELTFHSDRLFGCEGNYQTPFIVDGIYCPEPSGVTQMTTEEVEEQKQNMNDNVEAMINRIKKVISYRSTPK